MLSRTKVKFCGMTNLDDVLAAISFGVDAIGLIFHERSPRNVSLEQAAHIVKNLPPFITTVGVVVDEPVEHIKEILNQVPLDLLQFHGKEPAEYCRSFGRPYIKVIHIGANTFENCDFNRVYPDAKAFLLDTEIKGIVGGSGLTFDWKKIPSLRRPIILAGGLTPDNVKMAIAKVHPFAVDVTSGIEKSKGLKDHTKMRQFMANLQATAGK